MHDGCVTQHISKLDRGITHAEDSLGDVDTRNHPILSSNQIGNTRVFTAENRFAGEIASGTQILCEGTLYEVVESAGIHRHSVSSGIGSTRLRFA